MNIKWIGAILILTASGGFGFQIVATHLFEERTLRQLVRLLDYMSSELQYRLTPLPELCRKVATEGKGILSSVFLHLALELEDQITPDVHRCMQAAIAKVKPIPSITIHQLELLGQSLGRFDLQGQIKGLDAVRTSCRQALDGLNQNRENRLRSYQTLALCAGAALVILFI